MEVGAKAGLTERARSWVNATGLHAVPKGKLRRHRGRLSAGELADVAMAVSAYLDLDD